MAKPTTTTPLFLLSCSLVLVLCMAGQGRTREDPDSNNECQIHRLTALEPNNRIQAEGGLTEVWDTQDQQFQCSGVAVLRRTIEPNGLLLPSFTSGPELIYIEQGNGLTGLLIAGCPESYESLSQAETWRVGMEGGMRDRGSGSGSGRFQDQHQKVRHLRQGDVFALPAGVAHWAYNNGDEPLVAVVLVDTSNHANQLDKDYPQRFYLAGKPQQEHGQEQRSRGGRSEHERESGNGNVFSGFNTDTLAKAFGVNKEIAEKLQAEQDDRGNIILVKDGLHVIKPPSRRSSSSSEEHHRRSNGLEETICSARLSENVDDPSKADVYTPRAGRLTTLNSYNLPILSSLRLSVERGVLYRNAMMAPHYNLNAHSIVYGVRGRGRIQIVNTKGDSVFDDELRQGQVVVVPQNYAVIKQASDEGFEWVAFKTCENALFQTLAGRTSAIRALPVEVVSNIFQISHEQAYRLKFNRLETTLFRPHNQDRQRRDQIIGA